MGFSGADHWNTPSGLVHPVSIERGVGVWATKRDRLGRKTNLEIWPELGVHGKPLCIGGHLMVCVYFLCFEYCLTRICQFVSPTC